MNYQEMSDTDLKKEYNLISEEVLRRDTLRDIDFAKSLVINGITCKDIAVIYGYELGDGEDPTFSFYVKHDGKVYDIYYEHGTYDENHNFHFHPWWPIKGNEGDEDWDRNGAFDFIPPGFVEACENMYEYHGTKEEAIAQLRKHGITDIKESE